MDSFGPSWWYRPVSMVRKGSTVRVRRGLAISGLVGRFFVSRRSNAEDRWGHIGGNAIDFRRTQRAAGPFCAGSGQPSRFTRLRVRPRASSVTTLRDTPATPYVELALFDCRSERPRGRPVASGPAVMVVS